MGEMGSPETPPVTIRGLNGDEETRECARMMASSEPWVTLNRGYSDSLRLLSDPSREVYVADAGGAVAGFIVLEMRGSFTGYVKSIYVAPEWRGRGVGRTLMGYAEEHIFKESPNVFICVSDFNTGARRLYERLGYETIGVLRDYVVRGHSEVLMRKSIGPLDGFEGREET